MVVLVCLVVIVISQLLADLFLGLAVDRVEVKVPVDLCDLLRQIFPDMVLSDIVTNLLVEKFLELNIQLPFQSAK